MNIFKRFIFFSAGLFLLHACETQQEPGKQESDYIEITDQQFKTEEMELGELADKVFESIVKCNGTIVPLPNGMALVSAPVNGLIKKINCYNGQFVEQGQLLMEISGNEIIDLQRDFAEASATYKRLRSEYDRIGALYNERVVSEKDFVQVESEFSAALARYNGFKLKIESVGFSASRIENGEFYSSYTLSSPIKGYISAIKVHTGSYVDSHAELTAIINPALFQLKLSVFASDISYVKKGQTVRFRPAGGRQVYSGTMRFIGAAVDSDTKSIECYASIDDKDRMDLIANEFVEAEVITRLETVHALPSDAIIKTETGSVVLVLEKQEGDNYFFSKVDIQIGRQENGYIEVLTSIPKKILTRGGYHILLP